MNAIQYLAMASLVIESGPYRKKPMIFNRPVLNAVAIGMELLLKYAFIYSGSVIQTIARQYGHDIKKLWNECPSPDLLHFIRQTAVSMQKSAVERGLDEPIVNAPLAFEEAISALSELHNVGGSQLRYLSPSDTQAPNPIWLTETFYSVADACLKRPPFGGL